MVHVNFALKEINCKIVYYGPGMSGKTTNLVQIHNKTPDRHKGDMTSIATEGERTLFFDFLPMDVGKIKGFDVRVQLFTVPGQVKYSSTRKMVLRGVDGVVFVADSLAVRREKNMISLQDLQKNLREYGISILKIPLVFQYNKRDLAGEGVPVMSIESMERDYNRQLRVPSFPASAAHGHGVGVTLKECLRLTLQSLIKQMG